MLTDSTSLRLGFLLGQRPEDGFLYSDVLSGILEDLDEIDLIFFIYPQKYLYPFVFPPSFDSESLGRGEA